MEGPAPTEAQNPILQNLGPSTSSHLFPLRPRVSFSRARFFSAVLREFKMGTQRRRLVGFLIESARKLEATPTVKYTSLSLFLDRFLPSLPRYAGKKYGHREHWLLRPPARESNLELFALVSLWISSKIHDSHPFVVKDLKHWGDERISEQHFTVRDFIEAEVLFLEVLNYEIGVGNIALSLLDELLLQLKGVSKVGELVNLEACMDIMDLVYEKEETSSVLVASPLALAASILAASFVITVPQQTWEFPLLSWVKFATSCDEEHIARMTKYILKLVFEF